MIEFYNAAGAHDIGKFVLSPAPDYTVSVVLKKECQKDFLLYLTILGSYPGDPDNCMVWVVSKLVVHSERKGTRILAGTVVDLVLQKKSPKMSAMKQGQAIFINGKPPTTKVLGFDPKI